MYNILLIFSLRALSVADDLGIVYCWKKVYCDLMEETLNKAGLLAFSYHSGRTEEHRESVQNMWKENKCQVDLFTFLL